jgi:hypothetical protein
MAMFLNCLLTHEAEAQAMTACNARQCLQECRLSDELFCARSSVFKEAPFTFDLQDSSNGNEPDDWRFNDGNGHYAPANLAEHAVTLASA